MFEIILVVLVGSFIAGVWDLWTTEVPDELPYIMISLAILFWFVSSTATSNFFPLAVSLSIGTLILALGLVLYRAGKWGGADAWLFAVVAYAIPIWQGQIFILPFIVNFLIVSVVYMVVYALALGIKHPGVWRYFSKDVRNNWQLMLGTFIVILVFFAALSFALGIGFASLLETLFLFALLIFFWRYAYVIDKKIFVKKIHASKVRVGDVLMEMKWIGLTEEEVKKINRQKRYVTIKEGVRFVPVFFITTVVTLLMGNLLLLIL